MAVLPVFHAGNDDFEALRIATVFRALICFLVQPAGESYVNAEVTINGGLKASKVEPWRQVVIKRPAVIA